MTRAVAPLGHHLLDRRRFLSGFAAGLGGIALCNLLANEGLLASVGAPR